MKRVLFLTGGLAGVFLLTRFFKDHDCGCGCGGKKDTKTDSSKPVVNILTDTKTDIAKSEQNPFSTAPKSPTLTDSVIEAINLSNMVVTPNNNSASAFSGFQETADFFGN
ncbi:hypothetical protein HZR02_15285 [Elizabethkingia anophelis]|nr:hypothetical protein [Elizabethkingia anophelis]MCT3660246.1 hypothetical protein [Elizabethkingia anophelis]MCT3667374.1 hypothetical protein [Elizabethkingia anophelis]MCT3853356.1 hypothetical protein [Elizabethkingia anophelis]MCT3864170.1 hypothetical protein [Elizabethkingia anophelis]